jgi:hypothetical protein
MIPQEEEAYSSADASLHCCPLPELSSPVSREPDASKAVRLSATTPDIPIYDPRFPRILPQSPSAYIFRPLPSALVLLPQEVLSVPRQTVSPPAQTREPLPPSVPPLCLPCPSSQPSYRETNWTPETQQRPTPMTLQMTSTPDRHDTESPALSYLEPTVVHGRRDSSQAGSPGPRAACPATPYYNAGSECGDSDNDKENRRTTIYDLSSSDFTFIYKYAKAANLFFRTTHGWPLGLGSFSFDILDIAHQRLCPEHANDFNEHNNADWASVYHALKAAQGQLEIFASAIPATEEEIQKQETTVIEVINVEPIGGPGSLRSSRLGQHLWDISGTEEDTLMKDYGWVEYDPFDCTTVRVPYEENGRIKTCRWVKYDLQGPNPTATGTEGLMRAVYEVDLHTNPRPAPNYTEPHHFCDDALQIFHPDHGSRALVDRALTQIGDPGLHAEVVHYRFCLAERDDITLSCRNVARAELQNDEELLACSRFLANARGASRIGTAIFAKVPPSVTTARRVSPSPKPRPTRPRSETTTHIPPITASQGPPDRPSSPILPYEDGQFTYALSPPDNYGAQDKIPFCRHCHVRGHDEATCTNTSCYFCASYDHSTFACPRPHFCCQDNHCWVPLSHSYHGLACPAQVDIDMEDAGHAACEYCEDLSAVETCVAASS